jgi:SWI/SNF-related matrix-associated actin-dependent regulator 1 of chromatin subfamily A
MINLNHLTGKDAEDILKLYEGKNPYIRFMKKKFLTEKKYFLTKNQVSYIKDFHNVEPKEVNKIVELTEYFAKQLIEDHKLTTPIKKLLVETILAESDKWFHVIGKFYKKQTESKILWLPKSQLIDDPNEVEVNIEVDFEKYTKLDKRGFKLFKHQEEAIKFLMSKKGCILALPMGSGKTMTSILGSLICDAKKILVICPSSLKINWMREIQNFTDDVTIVSSNQWSEAKFTIINYDILKNFHTIKEKDREYQYWELKREIVNFNPDLIIMDEAHFLKNPKSIRAKILNDITQIYPINRIWLLTGTPVANRPMDYFNLLSLIKSPVASNWVQYARTYCDGKRFRKGNKFIWVTDGASNLDELAARTKNCLLRRKKEDILDLPEKIISPVYLELKNKEGYEKVWDDYIEKRKVAGKKGNISKDLVETTLLRSFIAMETVPYSIEKTEEALEYGKKVIIFCNFNDEMDAFLKHFGDKAVCVRGGMSDMKKQASVDRFQTDDKCMVFVGQIKAAGVGLTLTKAEIVIMNSLDWVPGNHEQAEDRSHRIGQTKSVNIYYMLIDGTIDTMVWYVLKNKKKIINTIVGDNDILNDILEDEE